uniref:Uncharacterized protein n=1 Tax=Anguilla anguilla TaxID=7936 RepID=A0A0E9SJ72_ANGAN
MAATVSSILRVAITLEQRQVQIQCDS